MTDPDEFDDVALDRQLHQVIDTEGRFLGEQRAVRPSDGTVPEMRLKTCPYAGSRHHHPRPMNISALQQITAHWPSVLDGMAVLRGRALATEEVALDDIYRIVRTATLLPAYLTRRRHEPVGVLDPRIATLYKVAIGYVGLVQRMGFDLVLGEGDVLPTATVAEIMEEAESNEHFIGPAQVCAGPANMVREVLEVIVRGDRRVEANPWTVEPIEIDRAFEYANRVMQLELTKTLLGIEIWQSGAQTSVDGPKPHMSVTWDLDDYSEEERALLEPVLRRRVASHVRAAVARRGATPASVDAFFYAFEEASEVRDVARYLEVERAALSALTELRDLARKTLGVEARPPLVAEDVTRVFGPTLRDLSGG
jgi:hypothetical protein